MTSPKYAKSVPGLGRYYFHPETDEKWPSITNVLDVAVAKPALVPWAAKVTEVKARDNMPRYVALSRKEVCDARTVKQRCGKCIDCLSREVRAEVKIAKDMAADLGTRIHAMAEAHAKGQPLPDDPEVKPYFEQVLAFFDDYGIDLDNDVEAAEGTVINRTHGYAGTGDLWVWLRIGSQRERRLVIVDYKSSATRDVLSTYPEYGMQLAALFHGETLLLDDGTEVDCPKPDAAAVLNLRVNGYALIPLPRDIDAAFTGFLGCLRAATYLHGEHGYKPQPATPPAKHDGKPDTEGTAA